MNNDEIRQLFERDEAHPPRPGYWEEIQARLEAVDAERAAVGGGPTNDAAAGDVTTVTDTGVTMIRPSTMNSNDSSRTTQRNIFLAAAAVLVVALVGVGLLVRSSGDDDAIGVASDGSDPTVSTDGANSDTSTTTGDDSSATSATPTTSEEVTASTTATTSGDDVQELVNEAEDGLRFDYGIVERIDEVDGTVWIWFDRAGFTEEQLSGLDHQVEPRYELASDWHGGENVNTRLRTFPLAEDATILLINPIVAEQVCAGEPEPAVETFEAFTLATVLADGWQQLTVSLTFNDDGEVTMVRDQTGC